MANLNAIIHRSATDSFFALLTADAMQSIDHVDVVSIVQSDSSWHVFAKYASWLVETKHIDDMIDKRLQN